MSGISDFQKWGASVYIICYRLTSLPVWSSLMKLLLFSAIISWCRFSTTLADPALRTKGKELQRRLCCAKECEFLKILSQPMHITCMCRGMMAGSKLLLENHIQASVLTSSISIIRKLFMQVDVGLMRPYNRLLICQIQYWRSQPRVTEWYRL